MQEIQNDILRRGNKIVDDPRPEARTILGNDFEALSLLGQCIKKAEDSTRIVNSFGPHQTGQPRLGVG